MQRLDGRVAALNRFITRLTEECLPFFKVLRKVQDWDIECGQTFNKLKEYLTHLLLLSQAEPGEDLLVYLSMSPHAVSTVLVQEKKDQQRHVYYMSRAFRGAEVRYPQMDMMAFALVIAIRRLRPYF